MRHYVINVWKRESNFHGNGTEIRECAVHLEVMSDYWATKEEVREASRKDFC